MLGVYQDLNSDMYLYVNILLLGVVLVAFTFALYLNVVIKEPVYRCSFFLYMHCSYKTSTGYYWLPRIKMFPYKSIFSGEWSSNCSPNLSPSAHVSSNEQY